MNDDHTNQLMIFDVLGLDENRPLAVHLPRNASFRRGSVICAEEIALIEQEIVEHAIPMPSRGSPWRPRGRLAVSFRPGGIHLNGCEPVRYPAPFAPWWKALPIVGARLFWRTRLHGTAATVLETARRGRILLVGEHAATITLAHGLARYGKEIQQAVAGSDGSSRPYNALERSAPGSLFVALHAVSGDLSAFGAVVFIGNHDFAQEHAAILDCTDAPPVILARLEPSGLVRTCLSLPKPAPVSLPRISIVTVSYNQAPYLEACISSVLNQGYPGLEYIIIDGGSTDGSVEIIERYRAAFAHVTIEPDKGQSDALNKGFARTTGEVLNWLCSDDMLAPGALRHVGEAYARHRSDLVAGGCKRLHESHGAIDYNIIPHCRSAGRSGSIRSISCSSCALGRPATTSTSQRSFSHAASGKPPAPTSSRTYTMPWTTICGCEWRLLAPPLALSLRR